MARAARPKARAIEVRAAAATRSVKPPVPRFDPPARAARAGDAQGRPSAVSTASAASAAAKPAAKARAQAAAKDAAAQAATKDAAVAPEAPKDAPQDATAERRGESADSRPEPRRGTRGFSVPRDGTKVCTRARSWDPAVQPLGLLARFRRSESAWETATPLDPTPKARYAHRKPSVNSGADFREGLRG